MIFESRLSWNEGYIFGNSHKPYAQTVTCHFIMTSSMTEIRLLTDNLITDKIEEFDKLGACIEFKVFEINDKETSYENHYETAKNTLFEISKESKIYFQKVAKELNTNRDRYFKLAIHLDKLENSGNIISIKEFLGPHYDLTVNKPIIRGQTPNFLNSYFYFDKAESAENVLDFSKICGEFKTTEFDGTSIGFAGAFLEPPLSVRIGRTIFEHGNYFNQFCETLFSDFAKIEIYKWSIDCSNYFNAGKEWWGSHFWTIYNPTKNIYIGATASTTD